MQAWGAWHEENVRPGLRGLMDPCCKPRNEIAREVLEFAPPSEKPEFWAWYADYDWVAFCWLFGKMIDLPKGYPMYCRDLKQLADTLGNPHLPEQSEGEHNALADARHNVHRYDALTSKLSKMSSPHLHSLMLENV